MNFYGWKLLAGISMMYFLVIGTTIYGVGVVLPPMSKEFGWSRTEASIGFSILVMVLGLSGPLVAMMIHRFGARATMIIGGFITFSGGLLTYYTESLYQFYLGIGVLVGLGMGMQTVIPATVLVTNWFVRRRSLAMGILMASGGAGAVMALPISMMIDYTEEWRFTWIFMGVAALISSAIAALCVKPSPADINQHPDGQPPELNEHGELETRNKRVYQTPTDWQFKAVLVNVSFWYILISSTISVLGATIINSQLALHIANIGLSPLMAGTALGLSGLMGAIGRFTSGGLGDLYDPKKIFSLGLFGQAVGILLLASAISPLWIYVSVITFGLSFGFTVVATSTLIANFYGIQSNANLMAVRGIVVTAFAASGPILTAYSADVTSSYTLAFYIYSGLAALASVVILNMPLPHLTPGSQQQVSSATH